MLCTTKYTAKRINIFKKENPFHFKSIFFVKNIDINIRNTERSKIDRVGIR
jgi:hypothetical protein